MKASLLLRQPARAAPFLESRYPLEQPRGSLGFPRPTPRGMAALEDGYVQHPHEALVPVVGAPLTRYDALSLRCLQRVRALRARTN